ncbi:Fc.00g093490.m01.CDS01 [Cosmosporella sp. VM-42]
MVKIAIAGGSGNVAQEIIDVLAATKKHEILLLSRKDIPDVETPYGVTWVKANYTDPAELAKTLHDVHTVLSFIDTFSDEGGVSQKSLIDAAVLAGVKRFAPSEWSSASVQYLSWYNNKPVVRQYLENLNKDKKVLEYCLFQPGFFVNYFTYPYESTKHISPLELPIDFNNRRAIILDDNDVGKLTLTTVHDLASVVARAVEYEGEWPVVGGIKGSELTMGQLIAIGEKIRGGSFAIERLKAEDLKAGQLKASWIPKAARRDFPAEQLEAISTMIVSGVLMGISAGALQVSDEWNQLLPEYKLTQAEEFLAKAWKGKP